MGPSAEYADFAAACTAATGSLTNVGKGQTCDELASTGGMTLAALKALNPHLNCTKPQAGWAVCLKATGTSVTGTASAAAVQPLQG